MPIPQIFKSRYRQILNAYPSLPFDSSISDHDLMQRVARGDTEAFECLVKRHQAAAWQLACRFLGDPQEARDMVQEAFIRVLQSAPRYRPVAAFPAYLARIVGRLCLDFHRRKRPLILAELPEIEDSAPTPDEILLGQERAVAVQTALTTLPANQRLALILRYYNGYTYQEIAAIMETSEKAVERLLARGRTSLAGHLSAWLKD